MTWWRKENNNYNHKSLIVLGKVSYIDHMKSFSSKTKFSEISFIMSSPLKTFSCVLLRLPFPLPFFTALNTIQSTPQPAPMLLVTFFVHVEHLNLFYYDPFLNLCHINISSYTHFVSYLPSVVMHLS